MINHDTTAQSTEVLGLDDVFIKDVTFDYEDPKKARRFFDIGVNEDTQAILINSQTSNGTVPEPLIPLMREYTKRGMPVFIIAGNYGTDHGVLDIVYDLQQQAVDAGAVLLRDVNVNQLSDVAQAIQRAANNGLSGNELRRSIIEQFGSAALQ